jgi:hypothetical protein
MFFLPNNIRLYLNFKESCLAFAVVLVGQFSKINQNRFLLKFWPLGSFCTFFTFSWLGSSIVKVIQQLKHERQHSRPPLKIAEKPDTFSAMALFFMSDTV